MSHHEPLTYGSLFSGIDGIGLALDRAGLVPAFQCEINPAPRSVLERQWPNVPKFTDVQEVHAHDHRTCPGAPGPRVADLCPTCGGAGHVDVLVGGFPCQDLSVAGGRRGLAGPRSGLWWHFARLLAELAPTWCIIENVPGLLSSNDGRDMGTILGTLGDLGYGHAFRVLDAQWFGVAQRRERVVIVGCAGDWTGPAAVLLEPETGGGHPPTIDEKEARAALRAGHRPRKGRRGRRPGDGGGLVAEVASTLLAQGGDGDNRRGQRLDAEGAAGGHLIVEANPDVSPTVTSKWRKGTGGPAGDECQNMIVEAVPIAERGRDGVTALEVGEEGAPYNALRAGDGGSSRTPLVGVFRKVRRASDPEDAETWAEDDVANTLNLNDVGGGRTTQAIVEAVPVDVRNASRTGGQGVGTPGVGIGEDGDPAYTVCTNPAAQAIAYAVTPEFGQGGDLVLTETEVAGTLTVNNLGPTSGDRQPLLLDSVELVVRRLLPVECLRLQGFPDDWCGEHDAEWNRPGGLSDSATYAAAGNAVAVPVFHWTALRLVKAHEALIAPGWRHERQDFAMPEVVAEPVEDADADPEPLALF